MVRPPRRTVENVQAVDNCVERGQTGTRDKRTVDNVQAVENGTGVLCRTRTDRNTGQTYREQRGQTVKSMDRHTVENMDRHSVKILDRRTVEKGTTGQMFCGTRRLDVESRHMWKPRQKYSGKCGHTVENMDRLWKMRTD